MFKNFILWVLTNVFKIKSETEQSEIDNNQKYADSYERIDDINFNAIFSNKLANYVINDSELNITDNGDIEADILSPRVELLNKTGQSMWKKAKKITSMAFGYGGVMLVPYVKGGKIYYSIVPQNRVSIDKVEGDYITGATVLAERVVKSNAVSSETYLRWTNYQIENNNLVITQVFTDDKERKVETPEFWKNIQEKQVITDVDRVLLGYIKSPINNRKANDKYGVPITYGCDATINEIKETMKQMIREYKLKEAFVGADISMFGGKDSLPTDGLFKKIDSGEEGFFEVYDPQFRDFTIRLQELYKRLEHEVGTSYGIISEVTSQTATATEIRKAMYDTFTIVDDMRSNIEKGLEDFFYACSVLANAYNLSADGEYDLSFNWSYSLLEDTTEEFNQYMQANSKGIISNVEIRQWLKPDETKEEAEEAIKKIKEEQPSVDDLLGRDNFGNNNQEEEQE